MSTYLFIDGASLHGYMATIAERHCNKAVLELNLKALAAFPYDKTFYYDAVPTRNGDEDIAAYELRIAPKEAQLERFRSISGVHVYEGDARRRRRRGGLEQKMVDVKLAVDMLTHTFRRNMTRAALLTGDQDFVPLVDALVGEGMFVDLLYPPGETSQALINAADGRWPISLSQLHSWLSPYSQQQLALPPRGARLAGNKPVALFAEWGDTQAHHLGRTADGCWFVAKSSKFSGSLVGYNDDISVWQHTDPDLVHLSARDGGIQFPDHVLALWEAELGRSLFYSVGA